MQHLDVSNITCLSGNICGAWLAVASLGLAYHALTVSPTVLGRGRGAGSVPVPDSTSALHIAVWPLWPLRPLTVDYETWQESNVNGKWDVRKGPKDAKPWDKPWHAWAKQDRLSNCAPPHAPPGSASLSMSLWRNREPRPQETLHLLQAVHGDMMQSPKEETHGHKKKHTTWSIWH